MEKIKKIILIRHGEHRDDELTDNGRQQIRNIISKLTPIIGKCQSIKIFSSFATRAIMTAEFIRQSFNVEDDFITKTDLLGDDNLSEDEIAKFIENEKAEIIILVTHHNHLISFPEYFFFMMWNKSIETINNVQFGEAIIINCKKGKIMRIEP